MPESGNEEQVDRAVDKIADRAIARFAEQHPEVRRGTVVAEIPAPLKWGAALVATLFTAGTAALVYWLVSSVSTMSITLARMDERMASYTSSQATQMGQLEGRVDDLEGYHRNGGE